MDSRVRIITRTLREHDRDLFAKRDGNGVIHVLRRQSRPAGSFEYEGVTYTYTAPVEQYIFSLTDTFKATGRPVDWGLEPIMSWLREIDGHGAHAENFERFVAQRERARVWRDSSRKQEFRAIAADMRSDFAKATNDIVVQKS